jgi:UrcA family protein
MTTSAKKQAVFFASMFAITFTGLAAAESAHSASADQVLTRTVAYGDLNIDTESGAKTLYARVQSAAHVVCAPLEGKGVSARVNWQACVDKSIDSAVSKINNHMLTSFRNASAPKSHVG